MSTFPRFFAASPRRMVSACAVAVLVAPLCLSATASGSSMAASGGQLRAPGEIRLSTSWSGTKVVSGKLAKVSGDATPASAVSRVLLQRHTPDGWQNVRSVDPSGTGYTLRVPTAWYGSFDYRVRAVARPGAASTNSPTKRLRVVPSYRPKGSAGSHLLSTTPVARWDPCHVIGYRVNAARARAGALRDTKGALRRVYQATGLRFVYRGTTDVVPKDVNNTYPRDTDLVIAWVKPGQSPLLTAGGGNPMGVGGAGWTYGFHSADGTPASMITSGHVVIDATQQRRTPAGFGRGQTRGELLMHEIGHAVGLQHVDDRRQLMYPLMQSGPARWGAGDLVGLAKVGAARGCLSSH